MKELPPLQETEIASDEMRVFAHYRSLLDLRGCIVLEVGGRLGAGIIADAGVRRWWSVDPRNRPLPPEGVTYTIRGVASKLPLPDESIDHVFSCNAFHHILDLPETLYELARVLRSGGFVYANFGPIWSGPDGSHIENLVVDGQQYDFWKHTLLPAWSHLVFDERELTSFLLAVHEPELARSVSHYVFHSRWINRLFFEDYCHILKQCPLDVVFMGGSKLIDYQFRFKDISHPLAYRLSPKRLLKEVQLRNGSDKVEIHIRDLELLLRKP